MPVLGGADGDWDLVEPRFHPEAFEERLAELEAMDGVEVLVRDYTHYPCVAVVRFDGRRDELVGYVRELWGEHEPVAVLVRDQALPGALLAGIVHLDVTHPLGDDGQHRADRLLRDVELDARR